MSDVPENAPSHCPGTSSADAGRAAACAGCPSQQSCQSRPKGPDPDIPLIKQRLEKVKNIICVLSGKGGVGKSTVSTLLAYALASQYQVGLLDLDICGPSIPRMTGMEGENLHSSSEGWTPVYPIDNLAVVSVAFLLEDPNTAVIWHGPKKNALIKRFLRDVDWGDLDYLIIDAPPGTSDEHLSISQLLPSLVTGVVLVTTPQEVALLDVRKEINFCKKAKLPIIGVVENMSSFVCPKCTKSSEIFPPNSGGAVKMCSEMGIELLGKLPLDPKLTRSCDEGKNFFEYQPNSPIIVPLQTIIQKIIKTAENGIR